MRYDIKSVRKVKQLREKGLSFRQIMRVMNKTDVKTIYRWYTYKLPENNDISNKKISAIDSVGNRVYNGNVNGEVSLKQISK
jgi:hypothetical protein